MKSPRHMPLTEARPRRGLSLQEMLIVIVVFIILGGILFLASNQAVTKTRISRVRQEQVTLLSALEAYRLDNVRYPATLNKLTGAGGYMESLPSDPFARDMAQSYVYYCLPLPDGQRTQAIIVSAGPDGLIDFFPPIWAAANPGDPDPSDPDAGAPVFADPVRDEIIMKSYDPTNGLVSRGDIIKLRF